MIITCQNIRLKTVTLEDIELIRLWRNSENVNRFLVSRDAISPAAQLDWFGSLNPATSIYFIISAGDLKIGLIYASNINSSEKSFEGNIFIGDPSFADSFLPVQASLLVTLLFFEHFGFAMSYSKVHESNTRAIEFDRKLGFRETEKHNGFILSRCVKEDFFIACSKMLKLLLSGDAGMKLVYEPGDEKYPFIKINTFDKV